MPYQLDEIKAHRNNTHVCRSKVTFFDEREYRIMNRVLLGLCATMLFCLAAFAEQPDERAEKAKALVSQMAASEFDKAVEPFDATMSRALPASKLEEIWSGVIKQYGALRQATDTRTEKVQQYTLVFVTCEFERGKLDTKVVFNTEGEIGGLFFVPSGQYQRPGYVDQAKFTEEEVNIGKGMMRLPGTLSVPTGDGPFSAIVLVHGSGPNDRDETIGPNKPFRDLAHGLASRGIAVLRYEKRTKQHPILMSLTRNSVTVKEETIDDAVGGLRQMEAGTGWKRRRETDLLPALEPPFHGGPGQEHAARILYTRQRGGGGHRGHCEVDCRLYSYRTVGQCLWSGLGQEKSAVRSPEDWRERWAE